MAKNGLPPIRACLFDMDGLLINSEDLYTLCTNAVLREYGKPDLPWNIKAQLQGRPAPEAGNIFRQWAQLPITSEEMVAKVSAWQAKYFPSCKALAGVPQLLQTLSSRTNPKVHIALATSSNKRNFAFKTAHLQDLFSVFPKDNVVLGDDARIPTGRGKPAPDIYLLALETINARLRAEGGSVGEIYPEECLVFEDSVPGVEAGRRAGMQVVWCPHPGLLNEYKGREKEVLAGLTGEHKGSNDASQGEIVARDAGEDIEGKEQRLHARICGSPGSVDDGWAVLLSSLEEFDYEYFGIRTSAETAAL
jgi:pseudouridine-5'-monophosphatase